MHAIPAILATAGRGGRGLAGSVNDVSVWRKIARYAATCPSPHNTQPFRLKVLSAYEAEVLFLPRRGLPVADPKGRFTWVTAGIFVEICAIAAHGLGFELTHRESFEPMYPGGDTETPQVLSHLRLVPETSPTENFDPALILARHTSRLPYDGSPIPRELIAEMQAEALRAGHRFEARNDKASIDWVIELNRQALFHDMEDVAIREELVRWLRFGRHEEDITHDGLSSRCLGFPSGLLRSFFTRPRFWTLPGIKQAIGWLYGTGMKGVGTIGWLRGPYGRESDWMAAGHLMLRLWLIVTRHGYYWHPYGSVITSDSARGNMIEYLRLEAESDADFVWLLLRLGRSQAPPLSYRLPAEEIILCA
jgi:hypothetical protein